MAPTSGVGWGAACWTRLGDGASKALREFGVFQDWKIGCPFRLTQKTDSLGAMGCTFQVT